MLTHVLVDHDSLMYGWKTSPVAQVLDSGTSRRVRMNAERLTALITDDAHIDQRVVWLSSATSRHFFESHYLKLHYDIVPSQDALWSELIEYRRRMFASGPGRLILVSGSGRTLPAVVSALEAGWTVDVYSWKQCLHRSFYAQQAAFPTLKIHFLDDHFFRFMYIVSLKPPVQDVTSSDPVYNPLTHGVRTTTAPIKRPVLCGM